MFFGIIFAVNNQAKQLTEMKKNILSLLFLLSYQLIFSQIIHNYEKTEILISQKKYVEAIQLLDQIIKKEPYFVGALVNRGICKMALKKYSPSIDDFKTAIDIDSLNTVSYCNIAYCYQKINKLKLSIDYYNKAEESLKNFIFTNPKNKILKRTFIKEIFPFYIPKNEIKFNRSLVYLELKNYNLALKDLLSIENEAITKQTQFIIASTLLKLNKKSKACIALKKAIKMGNKIALKHQKKYCI